MKLKIKNFILDTLFPVSCVSCGYDGAWLCENCFQKIQLLSFQLCPKCEKLITGNGRLCSYCRKTQPPLDALLLAARYKNGSISRLVHLYKYNFITDLRRPLGQLLIKNILKNSLPLPDLIIPVPLHRRRLRWRGFNQSALLADYVSRNLTPSYAIPVAENILKRTRYTPPQMKIKDYFQRKKNIQDAFAINKNFNSGRHRMSFGFFGRETSGVQIDCALLKGKTILLIDDIATTGATLFECAKVLKQNGAKNVFAAAIARQEMGRRWTAGDGQLTINKNGAMIY